MPLCPASLSEKTLDGDPAAGLTDRMPALAPSTWSPEQRRVAEAIVRGPRKALPPPFIPMLRSPDLTERAQALGEYLRFNGALASRHSELAILLVARHWRNSIEWRIHAPIALAHGISLGVIASIERGEVPAGLDAGQAAVHTVCVELQTRQSLSDDTWADAIRQLGDRALVDLIGLIGYYTLLAMLMNAAHTQPSQPSPPFLEKPA